MRSISICLALTVALVSPATRRAPARGNSSRDRGSGVLTVWAKQLHRRQT
jgi:hypothetical protein